MKTENKQNDDVKYIKYEMYMMETLWSDSTLVASGKE